MIKQIYKLNTTTVNDKIINNHTKTPSPVLQNDPDEIRLFTSEHYNEWTRLHKKSTRTHVSIIKFLFGLALSLAVAITFILTIITGYPTQKYETLVSLLLHLITCAITIAVKQGWKIGKGMKNLVLSILWTVKPYRILYVFQQREKRRRIYQADGENAFVSE